MSTVIEWIQAFIVVALGVSSFAVVFMGVAIALAGIVGIGQIKSAAVAAAKKEAYDRLERYLKSDEFEARIHSAASAEMVRKLLSDLHSQLTP